MIKILQKIKNIKCPKIIKNNNFYYIFGVVSKNVDSDIVRFEIFRVLDIVFSG